MDRKQPEYPATDWTPGPIDLLKNFFGGFYFLFKTYTYLLFGLWRESELRVSKRNPLTKIFTRLDLVVVTSGLWGLAFAFDLRADRKISNKFIVFISLLSCSAVAPAYYVIPYYYGCTISLSSDKTDRAAEYANMFGQTAFAATALWSIVWILYNRETIRIFTAFEAIEITASDDVYERRFGRIFAYFTSIVFSSSIQLVLVTFITNFQPKSAPELTARQFIAVKVACSVYMFLSSLWVTILNFIPAYFCCLISISCVDYLDYVFHKHLLGSNHTRSDKFFLCNTGEHLLDTIQRNYWIESIKLNWPDINQQQDSDSDSESQCLHCTEPHEMTFRNTIHFSQVFLARLASTRRILDRLNVIYGSQSYLQTLTLNVFNALNLAAGLAQARSTNIDWANGGLWLLNRTVFSTVFVVLRNTTTFLTCEELPNQARKLKSKIFWLNMRLSFRVSPGDRSNNVYISDCLESWDLYYQIETVSRGIGIKFRGGNGFASKPSLVFLVGNLISQTVFYLQLFDIYMVRFK